MVAEKYISEAVIRRLPKYYRKLEELEAAGVERISSQELSREMDLNASQIRRDFNCFGGFGQQGYGYAVSKLRQELELILNLDRTFNCVVIGAGNIGHALLAYSEFEKRGFRMQAIFDVSPEIIGMEMNGFAVRSMFEFDEFVKNNDINVGIICTPAETAQQVCDKLAELNITAVWNFAPVELKGPAWMKIENVNLSDSLYILAYRAGEPEMAE